LGKIARTVSGNKLPTQPFGKRLQKRCELFLEQTWDEPFEFLLMQLLGEGLGDLERYSIAS
jgi:hypothetical protein